MRDIINKAINMIIKRDSKKVEVTDSTYSGKTLEELNAIKESLKFQLYTSKGDARKEIHNKLNELTSEIELKEKQSQVKDKPAKGKKTSK